MTGGILLLLFFCSIFKPSGNLSWEGVEVSKYWQKMNKLKLGNVTRSACINVPQV